VLDLIGAGIKSTGEDGLLSGTYTDDKRLETSLKISGVQIVLVVAILESCHGSLLSIDLISSYNL
jgi:hypothetical protein